MKYCRHCGKPVEDGAKVCPNCFGSLEAPTTQSVQSFASDRRQSALVTDEGKAKPGFLILSLLWFILGIVFAVSTKNAGYRQASKSYTVTAIISAVISVAVSVLSYLGSLGYFR